MALERTQFLPRAVSYTLRLSEEYLESLLSIQSEEPVHVGSAGILEYIPDIRTVRIHIRAKKTTCRHSYGFLRPQRACSGKCPAWALWGALLHALLRMPYNC